MHDLRHWIFLDGLSTIPDGRWEMGRWRWIGAGTAALLVLGLGGYSTFAAVKGAHELVDAEGSDPDCRTPDVQFGWAYEAINYDIADDALLKERNPDLTSCTYAGTKAGDEVVTDDGIHIAGWYIPAGNGAGPEAPTVVLVHGFKASKSGILHYGVGLHDQFNLVAFDMRNVGRSSGTQTTGGVKEQQDLRAIIDWLETTKHPSHIGVLGNSLGAATALAEARDDLRVQALALDSLHTRIRYQLEARIAHGGYPNIGTTWAVLAGVTLRTGVDMESIDAVDTIAEFAANPRPLLLTHGELDNEDLPERTRAFHQQAQDLGLDTELHWCPDSGHNASAGMPAEVCADGFATWTRDFFRRALGT